MPPTPRPSSNLQSRSAERGSGSSGWSQASSNPASINQRPRVPLDSYAAASQPPGMVHRNPFQNPSPSPSLYGEPLPAPNAPFAAPGLRPTSSGGLTINSRTSSKQDVNLSVSYLPSKFSRPLSPGISYRKANKGATIDGIVKRGGGRDAFATGASRMPGNADEDYDGVVPGGAKRGRLHWNRFKWILFVTTLLLTLYGLAALIGTLVVWFNVWTEANIIRVGNRGELVASTVAASACLVTAMIGWAGLLLNNRGFLAVYTLCTWISFGLLVVPGYLTYKHRTFNLEGKVNSQWSRSLGVDGRLTIQNILVCCGYFSPFVEATISGKCYSRSQLPGCKGPYLVFERMILETWYTIVFSLVPLHLACIVAALLCSNHVTYRFGKGMTPKAYRLNQEAMAVIMDSYASQLAEQYGEDQGHNNGDKSRSNVALMDTLQYQPSGGQPRSRDSSNSGHEGSPNGGAGYGSYGSNAGLVDRDYPPAPSSNGYAQPRDKRL